MFAADELEERQRVAFEAPHSRHDHPQRGPAKNRGRLDTVAEIVGSCVGGANKSRVMLVAKINSVVATEMLGKLLDSGLVSVKREENSIIYCATQEGLDFVRQYSLLVSMLCPGLVPQTRLNDANRLAQGWI